MHIHEPAYRCSLHPRWNNVMDFQGQKQHHLSTHWNIYSTRFLVILKSLPPWWQCHVKFIEWAMIHYAVQAIVYQQAIYYQMGSEGCKSACKCFNHHVLSCLPPQPLLSMFFECLWLTDSLLAKTWVLHRPSYIGISSFMSTLAVKHWSALAESCFLPLLTVSGIATARYLRWEADKSLCSFGVVASMAWADKSLCSLEAVALVALERLIDCWNNTQLARLVYCANKVTIYYW